MVEEIKTRFFRLNIPQESLNSYATGSNQDLILKSCIGGAFYNRYIRAQYKNEDMIKRMKTTDLFQGDDA